MIIGDGILLGSGGESASIFITGLSETDTVTATNGIKTIIGKWKGNGFKINQIKLYGTWTITATDGIRTATRHVIVNAAVEYSINMSFNILYENGKIYIPLSFSVTSANGQIVNTGSVLDIQYARGQGLGSYNSYAEGVIYTNDVIDLTGYSTLYVSGVNIVYGRAMSLLCNNSESTIIPTNTAGGSRDGLNWLSNKSEYVTSNTEFTYSADISGITSARLYIRSLTDNGHGGGDNIHLTISKIWLE